MPGTSSRLAPRLPITVDVIIGVQQTVNVTVRAVREHCQQRRSVRVRHGRRLARSP